MPPLSFLLGGVTMMLAGPLIATGVGLYLVAGRLGDLRDREAPIASRVRGDPVRADAVTTGPNPTGAFAARAPHAS